MTAEELGERIEAERGQLRAIESAWCPKDERLVAAIYVVDGVKTLWLRGGRSGSHAEAVAEFERSRSDALYDVRRAVARGHHPDLLAVAMDAADGLSDVLDEVRENRYPATAPPMAYRVADLRLPWDDGAACSKCKRDLVVRLDEHGVLSVQRDTAMR